MLNLDKWATVARVEHVGETLSGLLIELRFNRGVAGLIEPYIKSIAEAPDDRTRPYPIERLRTMAFSHYIQRPVLPSQIDTNVVNQYVSLVGISVNRMLDAGYANPLNKAELLQTILANLSTAQRLGDALEVAVTTVLGNLGPLAAV